MAAAPASHPSVSRSEWPPFDLRCWRITEVEVLDILERDTPDWSTKPLGDVTLLRGQLELRLAQIDLRCYVCRHETQATNLFQALQWLTAHAHPEASRPTR